MSALSPFWYKAHNGTMPQIPHLQFSGLVSIKRKLHENSLKTTELTLHNTKNRNTMALETWHYRCTSNVKHPKFQIFHWVSTSLTSFGILGICLREHCRKQRKRKWGGHSSALPGLLDNHSSNITCFQLNYKPLFLMTMTFLQVIGLRYVELSLTFQGQQERDNSLRMKYINVLILGSSNKS